MLPALVFADSILIVPGGWRETPLPVYRAVPITVTVWVPLVALLRTLTVAVLFPMAVNVRGAKVTENVQFPNAASV